MPGGCRSAKPGRSEETLPLDEQARIAELVRRNFDALAPKRSLKPPRSECLPWLPPTPPFDTDVAIPEYTKFQHLQALSEPILDIHDALEIEEFVETDYYKDLNSVDKTLHHKTGTGFIKIETNGTLTLDLPPFEHVRARGKCNPATNDWIPSPDVVTVTSSKPCRSDP